MSESLLMNALQFAMVIPIGWLWKEKIMLARRVDGVVQNNPSKDEMKEYVRMANAPLDQKLDMLVELVKELREDSKRGD